MNMRKWLFLLMVALASQMTAQSLWQRAVVNHSRQSYRSGNQNWQIAQSQEGWMYFANNNGLLEYDGMNWTTYPLPGGTKVRSVLTVGDTTYVGALGQFGRFVRNAKGQLIWQSLSSVADAKATVNVWHIHRIGSDVFFQTDGAFYINDARTRLDCHTGVHHSAVVYNRLQRTLRTQWAKVCILARYRHQPDLRHRGHPALATTTPARHQSKGALPLW